MQIADPGIAAQHPLLSIFSFFARKSVSGTASWEMMEEDSVLLLQFDEEDSEKIHLPIVSRLFG